MDSLRVFGVAVLLGIVFATQGCAGAGLALFGVGAGTAAGTGTSYTLDGIAYRTFTASLDDVRTRDLEVPQAHGYTSAGAIGDAENALKEEWP